MEQKLARRGIALALLLLVGIGATSYRSAAHQDEAARAVARTHELIEELQKVTAGVSEAESSLRAFAIMREPRFLRELEPGIAREGLHGARRLRGDDVGQAQRLASLTRLVAERVALLEGRRKALSAGAPAHVSDEAALISARIRDLVDAAIAVERYLLRQRRTRSRMSFPASPSSSLNLPRA